METDRAPRLGLVIPAANTTLEVEGPRVLEGRASCHFQRFSQLVRDASDLDRCLDGVREAAGTLAAARVAAVGVGYTSGSFTGGPEWDRRLRAAVGEAAGRTAVTAASAMVAALRALHAGAVAVVSPYPEQVNQRLRAYLDAEGIATTALVGSPPAGRAGEVPVGDVRDLALSVDRTGAQALVISCTGLRTLAAVDDLERATGLPVVTSNQALISALLRAAAVGSHR